MWLGKWILKAASLLAALCFSVSLSACSLFDSLDRDALLERYDEALETAGRLVLTADERLAGRRARGADDFVGEYEADYAGFSGTEFLFGGTALEYTAGRTLTVRCTLEASHGAAQLYWLSGSDDPLLLLEGVGSCETTLELPDGGSCYLVLQGEALAGGVSLTVKDSETEPTRS